MSESLRVELKNVRSMAGDETPAFSATLYLDGKRVAYIRSEGSGGPPVVDWVDPGGENAEPLRRWAEWVERRCREVDEREGTKPHEPNRGRYGIDWWAEEVALFDLYDDHCERQTVRRHCRKKTLFRVGDEPRGEWRVIEHPYGPDVRAHLLKEHGEGVQIANEIYR